MPDREVRMPYAPAMRGAELTQGWVRLARAGVLGGASLFLATAGHVVGGGTLPGPGLLALLGVGLALIAVSLTARRLRFGMLLGLLAAEQLGMHLVLGAATATSACAGMSMPGHSMATSAVCGAGGATEAAGWSMLLGHTAAVLVTAWLLAAGERWLWRAVDRIHRYASARPTQSQRPRQVAVATRCAGSTRVRWLIAGPRAPPVA